MMVGLLGIMKAGAAYVPMDPAYPSVRIAMMLEDSHADVVLTHSTVGRLVAGRPRRRRPRHLRRPDTPSGSTCPGLQSDHLAYVIFTSGSTGRPKGVMVEHRNVVNFFTAMDERLEFTPAPTARRVAGRHQHLVRHLRARAVLDADARLHGRRSGRRAIALSPETSRPRRARATKRDGRSASSTSPATPADSSATATAC